MIGNKKIVEIFMDGFNKYDHKQILSCLTDDVEWEMPGTFHLFGKDAFDKEIENDAFIGNPVITITRIIEENNVVVAEGKVIVGKKRVVFLTRYFAMFLISKMGRLNDLFHI